MYIVCLQFVTSLLYKLMVAALGEWFTVSRVDDGDAAAWAIFLICNVVVVRDAATAAAPAPLMAYLLCCIPFAGVVPATDHDDADDDDDDGDGDGAVVVRRSVCGELN